jgi:hypothetical protein
LKELYEIGKAWDFDDTTNISRFFTHEMSWEGDMEFSIANKEFLLGIIENYKQKIISYHEDLYNYMAKLDPKVLREYKLKRIVDEEKVMPEKDSDHALDKVKEYFKEKVWEWKQLIPFDLNDSQSITTSWKFEYVIFELVRIYKTFDWENNLLIWSGH